MRTFAAIIDERQGRTTGFDYLRLGLAVLVLFGHSFLVTGNMTAPEEPLPLFVWRLRGHVVLPMFFALSGFLVAGSLLRVRRLPIFLGLRVLRLFPALAVEVILSAFILGPLLTTLPLAEYIRSPELARYMINLVGIPHYLLPGVFADNIVPRTVNASLWTVPYEAECYLLLAGLALAGLAFRAKAFVLLVAAGVAALAVYQGLVAAPDLTPRGTVTGRQLIVFFLAGCALYLARDRVPHSPWLALLAGALTMATVASHQWVYLSVFPVAYLTAYLGLLSPPRAPLILDGDYSYGTYLYAFPVQQTVQSLFHFTSTAANFGLSLALTFVFAAFSWHVVEGPLQRRKAQLLAWGPRARATVPAPERSGRRALRLRQRLRDNRAAGRTGAGGS